MIAIHKKRKNCQVYFHGETGAGFLSFEPEQLVIILKCVSVKYNIKDKIILNIPKNITSIIFGGWLHSQLFNYKNKKSIVYNIEEIRKAWEEISADDLFAEYLKSE